jgi:hypothetical protein
LVLPCKRKGRKKEKEQREKDVLKIESHNGLPPLVAALGVPFGLSLKLLKMIDGEPWRGGQSEDLGGLTAKRLRVASFGALPGLSDSNNQWILVANKLLC